MEGVSPAGKTVPAVRIPRTSDTGNSPNFRRVFCAIEHIHFPKTRVCYLRYVTNRRRVKAQDGYLSSFQIRASYPTNYLPL